MAKQYRVEITYADQTTEEYVIHSDKRVEWIVEQKSKTAEAFVRLFTTSVGVIDWFKMNQATKLEVTEEDEI